MPLKVIRTVRPAGGLAPLSSAHSITSPLGLKQKPTSSPVLVSTTVALLISPANVVPAGKVTSIRLLAAPASAPLPESVNWTAYWVRPPAAVVGLVLLTLIALRLPA